MQKGTGPMEWDYAIEAFGLGWLCGNAYESQQLRYWVVKNGDNQMLEEPEQKDKTSK